MNSLGDLVVPTWPASCQQSKHAALFVNRTPVRLHANPVADFAYWECSGAVTVELHLAGDFANAEVQPTRLGIGVTRTDKCISFTLPAPRSLCVLVDARPFYLYACPPAAVRTERSSDIIVIPPGQITDIGELELTSGQTLHIPAGAVARGRVRARQASHIAITGRGILDGGFAQNGELRRTIVFEHCTDVRVSDILMVNPGLWMLTFGRCERVAVDGLRQIGEVISSDGIDIVGCRHVRVQNCCLKNNDDCIAIKSLNLSHASPGHPRNGDATMDWSGDVSDVVVQDCILATHLNGTAMEIGHELRCDRVSQVTFRNIDVLCVHRHGSVFGIHNADRALVSDISWDHVFVEHHYDKLIDFRTVPSRWSYGAERGRVRGVRLENIRIRLQDCNVGYSTSLMGGFDAEHGIDDVILRNFVHGERLIGAVDDPQLDLYLRHATRIRVEGAVGG